MLCWREGEKHNKYCPQSQARPKSVRAKDERIIGADRFLKLFVIIFLSTKKSFKK